jgi:hypothetical protein
LPTHSAKSDPLTLYPVQKGRTRTHLHLYFKPTKRGQKIIRNDGSIPDFLKNILDGSSDGTGAIKQQIDLPAKDSAPYRENLTTCTEQDPAIKNYSQQQLEALLPSK